MKTQNKASASKIQERFELSSNQNGHYFQYKDVDDNVLLRSQAYQTAQGRGRGIKTVLKNASDERKYEIKKADKDYYFLLKGGNHQPIARSGMFGSRSEAEQAMKLFIEKTLVSHEDETEVAQIKSQKKVEVKNPEMDHNRFSFRIDLYRGEDEEKWLGKIEYPLQKSKISFQGLDEKAILKFITSHLPNIQKEEVTEREEILEEKEEPEIIASISPEEVSKKEENLPETSTNLTPIKTIEIKNMNLLKNGKALGNNAIKKNENYDLAINIDGNSPLAYRTKVFAKSLEHTQTLQIGAHNGELKEENSIHIPLFLQPLKSGVFRISATTLFIENDRKTLLESNCYLQLV